MIIKGLKMTEKLWEMNNQMMAIDSLLSENTDPETQEILETAKEKLSQDIESKMENILAYISECKARVDYLKKEEDRIAVKRRGIEKRIDWLRDMVFGQMKSTNRQKAEYGTWNVTVCKMPDKVVLTDDAMEFLPDNLCKITRTPDKKAIKDAMGDERFYMVEVDGRNVMLATVESGLETVRIK